MYKLLVFLFVLACASAQQTLKVCIPTTESSRCRNLERDDSQAICEEVESRIDCATKLTRGDADFGVFNEEETLLLALHQPNANRVVATIRNTLRTEPYAFEAVAIVPSSFPGGLDALKGFSYCHPGFNVPDLRWSPRVLKQFEFMARSTLGNQCPPETPPGVTLEELEVEHLEQMFPRACRPGPWSYNATIDADLKRRFPQLCSLCGNSSSDCSGYSIDMGVSVAGVNNNNAHIQALECLRLNGNQAVTYVAWTHVREFFNNRNPDIATSYAALCPDGSVTPLTTAILQSTLAPCAFVRQPWPTIVTNTDRAEAVLTSLKAWWPTGTNPATGWQNVLFGATASLVGGASAVVVFEDTLPTPLNYTAGIRPIAAQDATSECQPARRWCTLSDAELRKCQWVAAAAHTLGIKPAISCLLRSNIFHCLAEIKDGNVDFIASSSNYGYLARQHYQLSPIKLMQNSRSSTTRVAAFVKETSAQANVTRFENLRGKKACFPEYGGIAYVSFLRAAQERSVIPASECDYARAVGEFFDSACAPGALDASHSLSEGSTYNATNLCTVCQPIANPSNFTCAWDYSNRFFGSNGSLACLADPSTDVAVLRTNNIDATLTSLGMQALQLRALCRNNTLAAFPGIAIDDGCLLAHTIDAEVITRRNDPLNKALSVLLETLDVFFGYTAENGWQLINLEIFSPFDGVSDLLFRDSAIGFAEPSFTSSNEFARNYMDLFQHLEACTGAASGVSLTGVSLVTIFMAVVARFIVY